MKKDKSKNIGVANSILHVSEAKESLERAQADLKKSEAEADPTPEKAKEILERGRKSQ